MNFNALKAALLVLHALEKTAKAAEDGKIDIGEASDILIDTVGEATGTDTAGIHAITDAVGETLGAKFMKKGVKFNVVEDAPEECVECKTPG